MGGRATTRRLHDTRADHGLLLICCGDWCGENLLESALKSGMAAASQINRYIKDVSLPGISCLDIF